MTNAGPGESTGNAPGSLVYLRPRVPDRRVGLTRYHALEAAPGVDVHGFGKCAHDNPFGSGGSTRGVRVLNRRADAD
jgi:hypothetical protein